MVVEVVVRTNTGVVNADGVTFTDEVEVVQRSVRQHNGWESVFYKGQRHQLHQYPATAFWIQA